MAQEAQMTITGDANVAEALTKIGAFDDLLEACQEARDFAGAFCQAGHPLIEMIDAAIRKATEPTP